MITWKLIGSDHAAFDGDHKVAQSYSKAYVEKRVEAYLAAKGENPLINSALSSPKVEKFDINTKFMFIEKVVTMVAKRISASAIICGDGGLGKTHTVRKVLSDLGMRDITGLVRAKASDSDEEESEDEEEESDEVPVPVEVLDENCYIQVKGFSTAKAMYRTLFVNNGKIIVFDDCDNVLEDKTAKLILKGALDSYDRRFISWNSESLNPDDDLPKTFEFTGQVIFITNKKLESIDQALRSRSMKVDVSMTLDQKIERMEFIAKNDTFLPEYSKAIKQDAVNFIREFKNEASEVSLRTLIEVARIRATAGTDWRPFAEYMLTH